MSAEQRSAPTSNESAGYRWTGHPLPDMGMATLAALAGRGRIEEITSDDLEDFAEYAQRAILTPAIRSHASVLFTINVPYLQPSFKPERQKEKAREIFRSFARPHRSDSEPCVYCNRPSISLDTASHGAYRELVPMVTGQGVINFAPYGDHGFPVCGLCLTALQALIVGAPSCEGRALVISADDPRQIIPIIAADDWLGAIRRRIQLSETTGQKVDTWKSPRTRLLDRLITLARQSDGETTPYGFTIYHASNSGQGPTIDMYALTAVAVGFVRRAQGDLFRGAWKHLEHQEWRDAKGQQVADPDGKPSDRPVWRNRFYEDVFDLPKSAARFIRRYFLGSELRSIDEEARTHVHLWPLTEMLLEEVLTMDPGRIEAISGLGDALADEIDSQHDQPLMNKVFKATRYQMVRNTLIGASARRIRRGDPPLLAFEAFLTVFEEGEELPRTDWRLAWDLTMIRVIDRLFERDYFSRNPIAVEVLDSATNPEGDDEEDLPRAAQ